MTIVNGIEIDNIHYKQNDIKHAIKNNDPIEEKLNVVIVVSNPCLYARRYRLLNEFVNRFENEEENVNLFVVEMVYGNQRFYVTKKNNPNHLQIRTQTPLWHKENMVNLAVRYLLPKNYKAFAWIDADVEFESSTWALDTLKILNGCKDVVQIFSHCVDMAKDESSLNIFNSFGYSFSKNKKYITKHMDFWHPGYAWAITRRAYESIGGIFDKGVLGSGDKIFALSLINKSEKMNHDNYHEDYNNSMIEYQKKAKMLRLGYVPGVIRHYFHGSKKNRQYVERWQILMNHRFSPNQDITYDDYGVLVPTEKMSEDFKADIMNYFVERKEDD
jgi:hypothetical protein